MDQQSQQQLLKKVMDQFPHPQASHTLRSLKQKMDMLKQPTHTLKMDHKLLPLPQSKNYLTLKSPQPSKKQAIKKSPQSKLLTPTEPSILKSAPAQFNPLMLQTANYLKKRLLTMLKMILSMKKKKLLSFKNMLKN